MRDGRGLMFLSGLLLGMGIMLIILTITSKPRLIYTIPDISGDGETIEAHVTSTTVGAS